MTRLFFFAILSASAKGDAHLENDPFKALRYRCHCKTL